MTAGIAAAVDRPSAADDRHRAGRDARGDTVVDTVLALGPGDLAGRFGTPFYIYDLDVVTRQVERLRAALPPRFDLAYAVKANPALGVLAHLASLGVGADVASGGELEAAARAGLPRTRTVLTGPGKADTLLQHGAREGLRAVTVESPEELERLERAAAAAGMRVRVLLRLAAPGDAVGDGHTAVPAGGTIADDGRVAIAGHGAAKFGMGPADAALAARRAARSPHLEFVGVHRFTMSNVRDAAALAEHVAETVALGRDLAAGAGLPLRIVDAGGGLGIPFEPGERPLDVPRLGRLLAAQERRWARDAALRDMQVVLEPGRHLVGPAGAYVCRVTDVKALGGRPVAIVDGGIHHLLRPALVGQEHAVRLLRHGSSRAGRAATAAGVTIAGPLCTGLDVFAAGARVPVPRAGDLVAVLQCGAYGYTESMPLFLSHAAPAEIAVRGGRVALLRPRVEPEEVLDRQVMPEWDAERT
jgi:diaminopimelate decarboxylase